MTRTKKKPAARIGSYRIIPNLAAIPAETIEAFDVDEALASFAAKHGAAEIHDIILLRSPLFPVLIGSRGWRLVSIPDERTR